MSELHKIVCRCEDVTEQEILDALSQGYTNLEDLKRQFRIGMGPCLGQTCLPLVQKIVADYLGVPVSKVPLPKTRPLVLGVKLKEIKEGTKE
ncbi:MAG: (2Fe-2S)-binding protein [Candidatus Izemoplasmatales bacterium]